MSRREQVVLSGSPRAAGVPDTPRLGLEGNRGDDDAQGPGRGDAVTRSLVESSYSGA